MRGRERGPGRLPLSIRGRSGRAAECSLEHLPVLSARPSRGHFYLAPLWEKLKKGRKGWRGGGEREGMKAGKKVGQDS